MGDHECGDTEEKTTNDDSHEGERDEDSWQVRMKNMNHDDFGDEEHEQHFVVAAWR